MITLAKDVAVTVHDIQDGGRVMHANDAACRHFGVSRDTLLTWRPGNWDPHFDAVSDAALLQALKPGDSLVVETEHRAASGELVPVEMMHLCQLNGGVPVTICFTRDVSARKAEEARRLDFERNEAEQAGLRRLSRFVGNTPGYFYTVVQRPDGCISMPFATRGIEDIFALLPGDVEHDIAPLVAAIHPDDQVSNSAAIAASALALSPFDVEFRVSHPERGELWVADRALPQREPDGGTLWHGFTHEITARKRVEEALVASKQEFHTLAENLPDAIIRYDGSARPVYLNPSARRDLAFGARALPGAASDQQWGHPSAAIYRDEVLQALQSAAPVEFEHIAAPLPGQSRARHYHVHIVPEYSHDGQLIGALGLAHDISERKELEEVLRDSEAKFRALAESVAVVSWEFDLVKDKWTYIAPQSADLLGYEPDEWTDFNWWADRIFEDDREAAVQLCRKETEEKRNHILEYRFVKKDGSIVWVQDLVNVFVDNGVPVILRGVIVDIDERKQLEQTQQKREALFRELVENSPDTIARYDRHCRRVYANPTLLKVLGGEAADILGKLPEESPGGVSGAQYQEAIRDVLAKGKERSFELRWQADGADTCTHVRLCPEFDAAGQVVQVLAIGRDITEIDQYRRKIHHQAFFDALTGLPNRTLLSDRMRKAIDDAAYHGDQFGLMMLDLDHFKEVNDTMGHGAGDKLLSTVAKRLLSCVRPYDTVARLGGDEFSVLLPNMRTGDDLATIAAKVLGELAEPVVLDGQELFVTCSIGIALYPGDSTDIDALYKYADSAMYHAKKMGRNNFQFYQSEFTVRSKQRMEIETALRKAQKRGELELYYQPQIELQTGQLVSAEALLRWQRPGQGMVTPDQFIPAAEASGMIVAIGEWVLLTACQDAVCWNRERASPVRVAVNLSTRQFIRNDLVGTVRRILAETGCQPAWLELEITESLLLEDSSEAAAMLEALHGMGLSISIDDFGTGYSALSYLNRFPVSQIKIDRSFVNEVPAQKDKSELVKAMLSIAAALQLESVAEGVETVEQAEYLKAHGCRLAQGYLFGRPMPLAQFKSALEQVTACAFDEI